MITKFGEEAARDIKEHKESSEELRRTETRKHPDCPGKEAHCERSMIMCAHCCITPGLK